MKMLSLRLPIISTILLFSLLLFAAGNEKVLGQWYTTDKGAIVEIYECTGGKLCGKVVWLREPNDANGKPKTDINNPDPKLRTRAAIGMVLLQGFVKDGENTWKDGKIYDPNNGKTYSCNMTLSGDKLEVRGYIGISLFGRTENWTRVRK
ncbi:MAG: DUF2147 domain-containing protein [Chitinophagales bacterium]|nr:DUF2147 domain-containing protein [Chitinophagales bacterium]